MQDKETILKSSFELNKYIKKNGNGIRHQAWVLISSRGINQFNDLTYVCVFGDKDFENVIIEEDKDGFTDFKSSYNVKEDVFSMINQTLIIKTKDIFGKVRKQTLKISFFQV